MSAQHIHPPVIKYLQHAIVFCRLFVTRSRKGERIIMKKIVCIFLCASIVITAWLGVQAQRAYRKDYVQVWLAQHLKQYTTKTNPNIPEKIKTALRIKITDLFTQLAPLLKKRGDKATLFNLEKQVSIVNTITDLTQLTALQMKLQQKLSELS